MLTPFFYASLLLLPLLDFSAIHAAEIAPLAAEMAQQSTPLSFEAFTGKIIRNKVRLRLQPNLEGKILREFNKGDLLVITGELDNFYEVKPPSDFKGFVFRTFVLDNVVEGDRVNIRLEPDLEAAVLGQLSKGSQITGVVSSLNSKWLEITLPEQVRFYISKEYVENRGGPEMMEQIQKRQEEVLALLLQAQNIVHEELQKSFEQINLDPIYIRLNKVINQFADFPEQVAKARILLNELQEGYLQKKIQYLESNISSRVEAAALQPDFSQETSLQPGITPKMASWIPIESILYKDWAQQHENKSLDTFYAKQREEATILTGFIEPYIRSLRNKPGDYVLISKANHLPVAYLYSTHVDLQSRVGKEITLIATPRPNHNFAYPAYFVLAIE